MSSGPPTRSRAPRNASFDGIDYVPAHRVVLFGHHFASIAGAGPIVGPALAMCWAGSPPWRGLVGNNLHRRRPRLSGPDGLHALRRQVHQFVASDLISKRTGTAFYWIVFFLLVLVVAAFATVIASMFVKTPEIAGASIFVTFVAILLGT
jgi:carbon starvation protein